MQSDDSNPFASAAADGFAAWWSGSRQANHQWLQKHSPPLAELYLGANQLLSARTPGWTRFVAHAVRELVNRLPAAICGEEMSKGRLEYPQRIEALAVRWEAPGTSPGLVEAEIDRSGAEVVRVLELPVWEEIDRLIRDHRDLLPTRNRERALRMLQALVPESPSDAKQLDWAAGRWVDLGGWAHGQAHDQTRSDDDRDAGEIIRRLETLEGILHGVTRAFFDNKDELDELLEETNT